MKTGTDVNGSVSERSAVVLVLIDVINRLDFEGGEKLVEFALPMARRIVALKKRAKARGIPAIYVNDNFGRWKSDFKTVVDRCLSDDSPGRRLVELLRPETDDYFVLKPKQSGFFGTPLSILLEYLQARTLILTGVAGNNCVLFTAHDAYLRNLQIIVPSDCIASETKRYNSEAIKQMGRVLKADTQVSTKIRLSRLVEPPKKSASK
jgi:nicotinamidase-related amidase